MNPAVLDAFALIICAAEGAAGLSRRTRSRARCVDPRKHADAIDKAMNEVRKLVPNLGSYVAESDFFDEAWRQAFWGPNYPRLLVVKDKHDPDGLFFVHHGMGNERWLHDVGLTLGRDDHAKVAGFVGATSVLLERINQEVKGRTASGAASG
jgi:hypothetical protein